MDHILKELETVRRERDEARALCRMLQCHYCELVEKTISLMSFPSQLPSGMFTTPDVRASLAPGTSAAPDVRASLAPSTSAAPDVRVVMTPGTSAAPDVRVVMTPGTSAAPDVRVMMTPGTSAAPDVRASLAPSTSAAPDVRVVMMPGTSAAPDVRVMMTPGTSAAPDVRASLAPSTSAAPDVRASLAPSTSAAPDVRASLAPSTSAAPDVRALLAPSTSAAPDVRVSLAPSASAAPDIRASLAPSTSAADVRASLAPSTSAAPDVRVVMMPATSAASDVRTSPATNSESFVIPRDNDVLLLSDSLMRSIDSSFVPDRHVRVYAVSGLNINEANIILEEMGRQQVAARVMVLCIGTNDYYNSSLERMQRGLERVVSSASDLADRVVLSTLPVSYWKGRRFPFREFPRHDSQRRSLNHFITGTAEGSRNITVLPLDEIFEGHTGRREERGRGWYQRDAVHPNAAGTAAIEICLRQVLAGQPVRPPLGDEPSVAYDDVDISWRRSQTERNYHISAPLRNFVRPSRSDRSRSRRR